MRSVSRCLALLLFFATCAALQAHSTLESSEPRDGAVLSQAPGEVTIRFTEPIKVGLSTIEVHDPAGKQVDGKDARADAKEPRLVHLALASSLGTGTYKVTWTAVAEDMHVAKGTFRFTVAR